MWMYVIQFKRGKEHTHSRFCILLELALIHNHKLGKQAIRHDRLTAEHISYRKTVSGDTLVLMLASTALPDHGCALSLTMVFISTT